MVSVSWIARQGVAFPMGPPFRASKVTDDGCVNFLQLLGVKQLRALVNNQKDFRSLPTKSIVGIFRIDQV